MKRALPLLALLLAGCGGGGGASVSNPYDGQWSGSWSCPGIGEAGALSLSVGGALLGYPDGHAASGPFSGTTVSGDVRNGAVSYTGMSSLPCYSGASRVWTVYATFALSGDSMSAVPGSYIRKNGADHPVTVSLSR